MVPILLMKLLPIALIGLGTLLLARGSDDEKSAKRGNRGGDRNPSSREYTAGAEPDGSGSVDDVGVVAPNVADSNRRQPRDNRGRKQRRPAKEHSATELLGSEGNDPIGEKPDAPSGSNDGDDVPDEPTQGASADNPVTGEPK